MKKTAKSKPKPKPQLVKKPPARERRITVTEYTQDELSQGQAYPSTHDDQQEQQPETQDEAAQAPVTPELQKNPPEPGYTSAGLKPNASINQPPFPANPR